MSLTARRIGLATLAFAALCAEGLGACNCGGRCVPGEPVACDCPGGKGARVCPPGGAFECVCSAAMGGGGSPDGGGPVPADGGASPDGGGAVAPDGGPFSACVAPAPAVNDCTSYCASIGMGGVAAACGGTGTLKFGGAACSDAQGAPFASCSLAWNDPIPSEPRWECCCFGSLDAGTPDGGANGLSACVGPTTSYTSCSTYCSSIGRGCADTCKPPGVTMAGGAFAWPLSTTGCPGAVAGITTCAFTWNDAVGDPPRWECCCQ